MSLPLARIAVRNALRQRRRSALQLVVIGFSIAVVVTVSGALNGTQALLKERVLLGQTGVVQVHKKGFVDNVSASPLAFAFDAALAKRIEKIPGVIAATARIGFFAMANLGDRTIYTSAVAVDPLNELRALPGRPMEWGDARVSDRAGIISPEIARQLSLPSAADLSLLSLDADGVMNAANLPIAGIVGDNPVASSERKMLYVPLAVAQDLLRLPKQALEIAVRGDDVDHPEALAERIAAALGPQYEVHTWQQIATFAADMLQAQDTALRFVIGIFIAILLIGIVNAMLMNVLSRTREIGTMMAIGMTRRKIIALFIAESTFLGAIGAAIGLVLGLTVVALMHHAGIALKAPGSVHPDILRPFVTWYFVVEVVVAATAGGALAAVYPARRAANLSPIAALAAR